MRAVCSPQITIDLVGVAHPAAHARRASDPSSLRFRARRDARIRTSALRLIGESITEIHVVVDVEAQEDPNAGGTNRATRRVSPIHRRAALARGSVVVCARLKQALSGSHSEFRLSLKVGMVFV